MLIPLDAYKMFFIILSAKLVILDQLFFLTATEISKAGFVKTCDPSCTQSQKAFTRNATTTCVDRQCNIQTDAIEVSTANSQIIPRSAISKEL